MLHMGKQNVPNINAFVSDFITADKEWSFSWLSSFVYNDICNLIKSISNPLHDI